ncbi:MAG TPA: ankyrin repeat domain-containing protein [Chitinophaga sp.]
MSTLVNALKQSSLEEAATLIQQGEKIPRDLPGYETRQIFETLLQAKAYRLILDLTDSGSIERDIYEYEKLDGTIFESLFRRIGPEEEQQQFLRDFIAKLDNINDAVQDKTLLELAFVSQAPIETIRILADAGCDVGYKNNAEAGYLYKIVQEFNIREEKGLEYLSFLIEQGLDPNEGNIVGETPLHLAISKNKQRYIDFLLENGADLNQPDKNGETPLYAAVVHQVCDVVTYKKLSTFSAPDFDIATRNGETLLLGAVRMRGRGTERDAALLKALINDGADVYQTSPHYGNQKSALDWLCEQPAAMLEAALETGAVDVSRKDDDGNTLLHKVCAYNVNYEQEAARQLYQKVKLLIAKGADPNATNDKDQTPMMLAVQDNLKSKTVELLLKHKA